MRTIHADVSPDVIARGCPLDPVRCPVALAFKEALPPGYRVFVGSDSVEVFGPEGRLGSFPLPPFVRAFIRHADARRPVGPIDIRLELPIP